MMMNVGIGNDDPTLAVSGERANEWEMVAADKVARSRRVWTSRVEGRVMHMTSGQLAAATTTTTTRRGLTTIIKQGWIQVRRGSCWSKG